MKRKHAVNEYYHIYNRGTRKLPIVRDDQDRARFLAMLYFLNTGYLPHDWKRDVRSEQAAVGEWPAGWPEQKPLVQIISYVLLDNHFHLLLKEIHPGGIAKFMQRIGIAWTKNFNEKYQESGSLFQGPYRSRHITSQADMINLSLYINVKNGLERYDRGVAAEPAEELLRRLQEDLMVSLGELLAIRPVAITKDDVLLVDQGVSWYRELVLRTITARGADLGKTYDYFEK